MLLKRAGMLWGNSVDCVLRVPSVDLIDRQHFFLPRDMSRLRRFLQNWVLTAEDASEGAKFTVRATVRHRDNQGYRLVVLCRWRAGESINQGEAG